MARSRRRDDDDDDDDTPRRKKSRSRDDDDDDDDDEDEDEDDAPRRKKKSRRDDDDDDDDDRPRKKSRSRDDDDDDDDRPRKMRKTLKRSKKSSGGSGPLLLILGLVGGVILLAGGGFALWFFVFNDTPDKAFADYKDAFIKKDYGRVYDRLDKEGQAEFENMKPNPFIRATQSGKKGRELYIEIQKETEELTAKLGINRAEQERKMRETKLESSTVSGDTGTLTIRGSDGVPVTVNIVKQDGRWRIRTKNQAMFQGK